jgi:hypothetical protein
MRPCMSIQSLMADNLTMKPMPTDEQTCPPLLYSTLADFIHDIDYIPTRNVQTVAWGLVSPWEAHFRPRYTVTRRRDIFGC